MTPVSQIPTQFGDRVLSDGAIFRCPVAVERDILVITPMGEIDFAARPLLCEVLRLVGPGIARVSLDLSGVSFMDSSGISFLSALQEICRLVGAGLDITGLRPRHRWLLSLTGVCLPAAAMV